MKRMGVIACGLCLTIVALAGPVSPASAKSLFYLCVTGVAENPLLCPEGTGPFTEVLAKKIIFVSSGGTAQFVSSSVTIKCSSDEGSGEAEGPNLLSKVVIVYKGCKDSLGKECKTGAEKETIQTNSLSGELADLQAGEKRVGELLRPTTGTTLAEIKCSTTVKLTGEVMGEETPENSYGEKESLIFKIIGGVQQWRQVEEAGAFHELSSGGLSGEKIGLESTETILYSSPLGVMA